MALQCSPSKERVTEFRLNELSARELRALTLVEGAVALGWIASRWPGLLPEVQRLLPDVHPQAADMDGAQMLDRAIGLAATGLELTVPPLLGALPLAYTAPQGLTDRLRRSFGRMPWTTTQKRRPRPYSVPVGGDGGVRNPNLPPPSRPQDNDLDVTPQHRPGIPIPSGTCGHSDSCTTTSLSSSTPTAGASAVRCRWPSMSASGSKNTPTVQ